MRDASDDSVPARVDAPRRGQTARGKWGDLRTRLLSALVLAPIGIACIAAGGPAFAALALVLGALMAGEWSAMCRFIPWRWPGLALPLAPLPAIALASFGPAIVALPALAIGALSVWPSCGRARAAPAFGVFYVGAGAAALAWLRRDPVAGLENVLFLVLLVWASDSGAYLAGRLLGGPRMAPAISPGKTWSGAAGGLIAAMALGAVFARASGGFWARGALVAGGLGLAAQAGDLLESGAKRYFGVKDSSRLIPGHGGLLDRLDALLAAGPAAVLLALELGQGAALWR